MDPNLSLDSLSDRFGLNGKYLSKLFKEEFGMKFIDYVIGLRMEHAKSLLSDTDMPVQEIAEKLGYTSAIAFARTFRRAVGSSPSDYRKNFGGG